MPKKGFNWKGKAVSTEVRKAAMRGLDRAGDAVLGDAVNIVPEDTGELKSTGDSRLDEAAGEVTISFDGPYAVRQHEDLSARHKSGRKAKYLETPLREHGARLLDYVQGEIGGKK